MITGGQGEGSNQSQRWEEKELETLQKQRDALQAQLGDISKRKRKAIQDEHLVSEVVGLETRLAGLKDDLSAIVQKIVSCETEMSHISSEQEDLEQDLEKGTAVVQKLQNELSELDKVILEAEKGVFSDFCKTIGVRNIREYEQSTLKATEETARKRLEFSNAKVKLENM
jgi:structural maintenance of chromosome 1